MSSSNPRFDQLVVTEEDLRACDSLPSPLDAFFPRPQQAYFRRLDLHKLRELPPDVQSLPLASAQLRLVDGRSMHELDTSYLALVHQLEIVDDSRYRKKLEGLGRLMEGLVHVREVPPPSHYGWEDTPGFLAALALLPALETLTFKGKVDLSQLDQEAGPEFIVRTLRAEDAIFPVRKREEGCGVVQRAAVVDLPCRTASLCLSPDAATEWLILHIQTLPELDFAMCLHGSNLPRSLKTLTVAGDPLVLRCAELLLQHEDLQFPESLERVLCGQEAWTRTAEGRWQREEEKKETEQQVPLAFPPRGGGEPLSLEMRNVVHKNVKELMQRRDREEIQDFIRSFNDNRDKASCSYRVCVLNEFLRYLSLEFRRRDVYDVLGFLPRE